MMSAKMAVIAMIGKAKLLRFFACAHVAWVLVAFALVASVREFAKCA